MTNPFYKAKFDRLILNHDKYLIHIDSTGVCLTKNNGSGYEKDSDIELSWDEIFDLGKEWEKTRKPSNDISVTEKWDRESGDNGYCLPEDMGDK